MTPGPPQLPGILREIHVDPTCEWESRHYTDIVCDLARSQVAVAAILGEPENQRPKKLDDVLESAKVSILATEGIPNAKLQGFADSVEQIRKDVKKYPLTTPVLEETINAIENLIEQGVLFEMLETFTLCNCPGARGSREGG